MCSLITFSVSCRTWLSWLVFRREMSPMLPVGAGGLETVANLETGAPDTEFDLKLFKGNGAGGTSGSGAGSGGVDIGFTSSVTVVVGGGLSAAPSLTGGRGSCFVGDTIAGALVTPLGAGRV